MLTTTCAELFDDVVGQTRAVATLRAAAGRPVHAYLLMGPPGTGKAAAATSFAAALLCPTAGVHPPGAGLCDECRRTVAGVHPDVVVVEREGASIGIGMAREVIRSAFLSPAEGARKVVILHDFHLVRDTGPALLKTIEEPPPSTFFVILAEYLPPELVTIASRCVQVHFDPLRPADVVAALVGAGVEDGRAAQLAQAAGGRLDRARLLATDPEFEARRQAWYSVPARLDGTGATVAKIADELVSYLDSSVGPVRERHAREVDELTERNRRTAEVVGSGKGKGAGRGRTSKSALSAGLAALEERQKREQRRQRTDELRAGLATLATAYRDRLASAPDIRRRTEAAEAVRLLDQTTANLQYNPQELLLIQALLVRLSRLRMG